MQKIYNHQNVEDGIESKWREKKYFIDHNLDKKPFSILLPPPNVTGKLHLGHALDSYIPDTIIRFKKTFRIWRFMTSWNGSCRNCNAIKSRKRTL